MAVSAAPVRVTTWNLRPNAAAAGTNNPPTISAAQLQEAADALKKLKPEVIILQAVPDWGTCDQLAKALKPEIYNVVVCSAFRDARTQAPGRNQVAILSRARAYLSWTEAWRGSGEAPPAPGGFAFAAIHLGDKNTGIFSVQLSDDDAEGSRSAAQQSAREESARQLVRQIAALRNWTTNQLDGLVVAGDFNTSRDDAKLAHEKTLPQLERFGFENMFAGLPPEQRVTLPGNSRRPDATVDYIFTRDAGRIAGPQIFQAALSGHCAVTCDIDLAAPQAARAELPPADLNVSAANRLADPLAPDKGTGFANGRQILWISAGFLAGCIGFFVVISWRARRSRRSYAPAALLNAGSPTEGLIIAPPQNHRPIIHITMGAATQTQSQAQPQPQAPPQPPPPRAEPLPDEVRAGVIAQLTRWLKQKMVQRLVTDRAQLLDTQETAARKIMAVDERLTKIEQQLQQRNREYEERIDELEKELLTAQEENRELIRAKIALIKAEMEKERLKAEKYLKERQQN